MNEVFILAIFECQFACELTIQLSRSGSVGNGSRDSAHVPIIRVCPSIPIGTGSGDYVLAGCVPGEFRLRTCVSDDFLFSRSIQYCTMTSFYLHSCIPTRV